MTPPVDDPEALRRILAQTDALLLDFDGPICSVFSGIPAPVVADQLRGILAEGGHTDLPADIRIATDPFDILFYAAKLGPDEARYVEAAFRAHEVEAVQSAQPTPGAHDLMKAWHASGHSLAIVTNNSHLAVAAYLDLHCLDRVDCVAARIDSNLELLKPSPHLVNLALTNLGAIPGQAVFIGDSVTDISAARSAGVRSISYANSDRKIAEFPNLGTHAIATSMTLIEASL